MVVNNQVGDTIVVVVNLEQLSQTRLTDIQTYHHYLLAQQGEGDTDIGSHECLSFTRSRRGEHHHFLAFLQHKLDVGTQTTEDFLHQVVHVLVNYDICLSFLLGSVASHRNIGDYRNLSQLDNILMTLNLILEELNQEEDTCRDSQTEYQCDEHDDRLFRACLTYK